MELWREDQQEALTVGMGDTCGDIYYTILKIHTVLQCRLPLLGPWLEQEGAFHAQNASHVGAHVQPMLQHALHYKALVTSNRSGLTLDA